MAKSVHASQAVCGDLGILAQKFPNMSSSSGAIESVFQTLE
jgi:hypothetical protein